MDAANPSGARLRSGRTNLALLDQSCGGSCGPYAHSQSGYYNHNLGATSDASPLSRFVWRRTGHWSTCGTLPILHSIIETMAFGVGDTNPDHGATYSETLFHHLLLGVGE